MVEYKEREQAMNNTIHGEVEILTITDFSRENHHVKLQYPEWFKAITMRSPDGAIVVYFTKWNTTFAQSVQVGQKLVITGTYKRVQDHGNQGGQLVVTRCVIGTPKSMVAENARKAKIAARKAALIG
jgi:hypothetical protein